MSVGSSFVAFDPFTSKGLLEHDIAFLGKETNFGYQDIMTMPSSRRHKLVLLYTEQIKQQIKQMKKR